MNTQITLPVPELKTALSGLTKVIGRKTTLPVLSHVKVSRQNNGLVTLQATDLDAHATYHLSANQPGAPVELLVPLEQLNNALKCSGSKDEVALLCEGKDQVKLRYTIGGSPVTQPVNTLPLKEWPPAPKMTTESSALDKSFGLALKQALASCSNDESRYVLRGACLDVTDKGNHYVVGTNGRALFAANSFTFPLQKSVIIPDSKFLTAGDLLDDSPCFLNVQPGKGKNATSHIRLQTARWEFITREIDGNYPNWKQCVPTPNAKWLRVKLSPAAVSQLLQVVPKLPGQNDANIPVRLRLDKCLWAEGRNKNDKDWASVAIPDVQVSGHLASVTLNRDYLLQALKFGLDEFAFLESEPVVFYKEGKRMVIVPLNPHVPITATEKPGPTSPQPTTPPQPKAEAKPEERTTMPRTAKTATPTTETPATETKSTTTDLLAKVDQIRDSLKNTVRDLADLGDLLNAAEKEKRTTEKEIETIRTTLRKIQNVSI